MKTLFNYKKLATIVLVFTLATAACKKEGAGGKSAVSGYVKHHSKLIPFSIVYIKYGATEFPGADVSKYDASVPTGADAHYEFKELRKGDYFLYGVGYDSTIYEQVTGGIGIKLKNNKSITTDVPVTE